MAYLALFVLWLIVAGAVVWLFSLVNLDTDYTTRLAIGRAPQQRNPEA